ncbi:MAG: hypothetical protein A2W31_07100 [Planctomycetes bacterium RBG_16_64_10]|nr:MAG: hypothetical protein A2W31_07100 [Planctomycetes bacterium RBG_16_64_10]
MLDWAVGVTLVALALRTWVVQGLVFPVTVAGGSMAETLVGPHQQVDCAACGQSFAVGLEHLPAGGRATCAHCGYRDNDLRSATPRPGQHLLVDRTALSRGVPRRWQVVLFRCPARANRLGVKRIVGLPGESVRIRAGDVYIAGRIARKDLPQQRSVRQLVHRLPPDRPATGTPRWQPDTDRSGWQRQEDGFRHRSAKSGSGPPAAVDWLRYHHPTGTPVRDVVGYDQGQTRRLHGVTDLMLTCRVAATGHGLLLLAATDGRTRLELHVPNDGGSICLLSGSRPIAWAPIEVGTFSTERFLEWSLFDAQVLLAIDGTTRLQHPLDQADLQLRPGPQPLAIGTRQLGVVLKELTVWRDVYYTQPRWGRWGLERAYQLGADEVFVLGDNSPISDDSRSWPYGGGLPLRLVVGRPLGVD